MDIRMEKDTLGEIAVPADKYWGAQTQRSYEHFPVGVEKMPVEIVHAFGVLKKGAAIANHRLGVLSKEKCDLIVAVADEIIAGKLDEHFPLAVWQTGSGTQSNMNANEVIANRGNELAGKRVLHPNDDVNKSQSSNDTFPSAMHIAAVMAIRGQLLPALDGLVATFRRLEEENAGLVKCGRTHLQDAVPIAFSQEISGWRGMIEATRRQIENAMTDLRVLAVGGTAVGTGLNAPEGFDLAAVEAISNEARTSFAVSQNKFHALAAKDAMVYAHGALKALAADLMKIANDIRWLASGPRCGLGEISIPAGEVGSSIMPGKVNPTQCEMMTMVAAQVMANDVAVGIGASQGNFELNVYMPLIAYNFLQSVRLLADGVRSFDMRCVSGIVPRVDVMHGYLDRSLMLVTALSPRLGYEKAADVAKKADKEGTTLREACLALGYLTAAEFDAIVDPDKMV